MVHTSWRKKCCNHFRAMDRTSRIMQRFKGALQEELLNLFLLRFVCVFSGTFVCFRGIPSEMCLKLIFMLAWARQIRYDALLRYYGSRSHVHTKGHFEHAECGECVCRCQWQTATGWAGLSFCCAEWMRDDANSILNNQLYCTFLHLSYTACFHVSHGQAGCCCCCVLCLLALSLPEVTCWHSGAGQVPFQAVCRAGACYSVLFALASHACSLWGEGMVLRLCG